MSKHLRLVIAVLTIVFALACCSLSVFAEADAGSQDSQLNPEPVPTEQYYPPEPQPTDPYYPPETEQPTEPYYPPEPQPTEPYYPPEPEQPDYDNNSGGWYDSDGNSYDSPDDVYVGGGQSYDPPISTAPSAALYSTDKKIDVDELSKNDWGDIAAKLKNASVSGDDDGSGDFSFIQQNNSNVDNGHWIIIVGILCILLSITGFGYLIASGVIRRKKMKAGNISRSSAQNERNRYRQNDDYDDGYKAPAKKESKRSNGGRRYK